MIRLRKIAIWIFSVALLASCSELSTVVMGETQMTLFDSSGRAVGISMHITEEGGESLKGYFLVDATFIAKKCVEDAIRVPFDIKKQMSARDRSVQFSGDEIEFKCNATDDQRIDRIIATLTIKQGVKTEARSPTDRDKKVPAYAMQWIAYEIKRIPMSGGATKVSKRLERSVFKKVH